VFEISVLRIIFASKRDEGQDDAENCMMRSCIICCIRAVKSRRIRWAGHVARTER
jgi:hypothetical protein